MTFWPERGLSRIVERLTSKDAAKIAKALGDPTRLAIYAQIAKADELFCGEIVEVQAVSPGTISHHLKVLSELNLITARRDGLNIFYRAVPETLGKYREYLSSLNS